MKFSILIPSKNGEKYIENCIKSVIDQDFEDYEIIIGDNNNNKFFKDVLSKYLNNNKIKVINHNRDISVTENWRSCLEASNGDYIIMLGDDDCLLPNALSKIDYIISLNNKPECLSFNGISFYSANSFEDIEFGAYKSNFFDYTRYKILEGWLSKKQCIKIVNKMYNFENHIPLNMQPHVISKLAISRIKKSIYQPPFPDHYALNALLLTSTNWYISYQKIVAVGISNKSFGHYYFNSKSSEGLRYLGLKVNFNNQIDGSILNTCMMIWLQNIKKDFSSYLFKTQVKRKTYLYRQVFFMVFGFIKKDITLWVLGRFFVNLRIYDKLLLLILPFHLNIITKGLKKIFLNNKKDIIKLQTKMNIFEFTRTNKF